MKKVFVSLFLVLGSLSLATPLWAGSSFDTRTVDAIVVQHEGRLKPLLTFSKETIWFITGRSGLPNRGPSESLLAIITNPDRAYRMRMIPVSFQPLLEAMGLPKKKVYFSLRELQQHEKFSTLFAQAAEKKNKGTKLSALENKVLEVGSRAEILRRLTAGESVRLLPPINNAQIDWGSLAELHAYDPQVQEKIQILFQKLTKSLRKDQKAFDVAGLELSQYLRSLAPSVYPSEKILMVELFYQKTGLFRKAWLFYLLGFLLLLLPLTKGRFFLALAWTSTLVGFGAHTAALIFRVVISGRPPVSNMYESLIFLGWSLMVFTLIFSGIFRHRLLITIGSFLGFLTLLISDLLPIDSNVSALVPVLRSNYWLTIHVLTIVTSYAAFALAAGLGHFNLGLYIFAPQKKDVLETTTEFLNRIIQVGILLLAAGVILGGMWANESWGRFWGWDPKETWALISLIGYLIIVHGRFKGWLKDFGLALGSLIGFLLILMTYYGVNFILGQGLHSYGFASGGTSFVLGFVIFEILFMALASFRYLKLR